MDDFDDHKGNSSPSSLKELLSCCFRKNRNHPHHRMSLSVDVVDTDTPRSLTRSSSARYKSSSGSHHETPEIKDKCKTFISRFNNRHRRRHSASADFRYDPLSYALNFDEGYDEGHLADEFPLRNFSSRLPASPPKPSSSGSPSSREITAYS